MDIIKKAIGDLVGYDKNARTHSDQQIEEIAQSIKNFGFNDPIEIGKDNVIISGHARLAAAIKLQMEEVPVIIHTHMTEKNRKAYVLAANRIAMSSSWDAQLLQEEMLDLNNSEFDLSLTGFTDEEINDILDLDEVAENLADEDDCPGVPEEPITKIGDVWLLEKHRLMCGNATSIDDVDKLMNGQLADLGHNDPPYGMKKEKDGVLNDNLNFDDLLKFNYDWITIQISCLKENGSFYCWGIDEPLMDIYSEIIKPYVKKQKATFRNLITWDKGTGQGQNSEDFRMYPRADEKCLFVMMGVQGFNNNADNYFDGWEPIRNYLLEQRTIAGWDVPTMKKIAGHSDLSGDHWTGKSQFNMPTKKVYLSFQDYCIINNVNAFKKEYDELKKEYYSTRAYFNNTHDNQNNVWHFNRTSIEERKSTGGHATPKPVELCERAIKSSCPDGGLVIDLFGGSGSTLIACEKLKRKCFTMELDPKYCDVIVARYEQFTGKKAILEGADNGNGRT